MAADTVTASPPHSFVITGDTVRLGDLTLQPSLVVERARIPAVFRPSVTITNRSGDSIPIFMLGGPCTVQLRLYRAGDWNGTLVYPRSDLANRVVLVCPTIGLQTGVAAHRTLTLAPTGSGRVIVPVVGPPVEPGRYSAAAVVDLHNGPVELRIGESN
jgi:hypothetical protein